MPLWLALRMVTAPMPVFFAFSIAMAIAFGATMTPRPLSQSIVAVDSRSLITFQSGLRVDAAVPDAGDVAAQHVRHAVAVDAAYVGRDQDVGGQRRVSVLTPSFSKIACTTLAQVVRADAYGVALFDAKDFEHG